MKSFFSVYAEMSDNVSELVTHARKVENENTAPIGSNQWVRATSAHHLATATYWATSAQWWNQLGGVDQNNLGGFQEARRNIKNAIAALQEADALMAAYEAPQSLTPEDAQARRFRALIDTHYRHRAGV